MTVLGGLLLDLALMAIALLIAWGVAAQIAPRLPKFSARVRVAVAAGVLIGGALLFAVPQLRSQLLPRCEPVSAWYESILFSAVIGILAFALVLALMSWVATGVAATGDTRRTSLAAPLWTLLSVAIAALFFFPLYWAISTALRNPIDTFTTAGLGVPCLDFTPTLANFSLELSTPEGWNAIGTSLVVTFSAIGLALILGLPAAYALARFRFVRWGNSDITVWFLSQRVLPPVATLLPFYIIFRSLGLLDTEIALILINATFILPFVVVILRQTFLDLPVELEEAALVDGANHLSAFFRVALPLAMPAVASTALIIFAFAWNEFLFASSLGITQTKTMPAHMAGAVDTRGVQFWFMATRALIAMIPPVLLALFAQRYIVRGLTLGAVKG